MQLTVCKLNAENTLEPHTQQEQIFRTIVVTFRSLPNMTVLIPIESRITFKFQLGRIFGPTKVDWIAQWTTENLALCANDAPTQTLLHNISKLCLWRKISLLTFPVTCYFLDFCKSSENGFRFNNVYWLQEMLSDFETDKITMLHKSCCTEPCFFGKSQNSLLLRKLNFLTFGNFFGAVPD